MIELANWVRICSCWLVGNVDDAVDRAVGRVGVQRGEHHVAGFGGGDDRFDRLQVAHFADEDHVRVLAQSPLESLCEAVDVDAHLALVDGGLLVEVIELDRVFDRDDVPVVAR